MDFTADFTAIDFETASRRSDSACQLGAVKVRDGKIVDTAMWMIRPEPLFFSPKNIQIHGIRPDHVRDEPTFGDRWDEIYGYLADDCLVAHNASFDMGVLLSCLRKSRRNIPELHYTCTRAIARRTWPRRRRYGLKPLSQWLGTEFRHHDALEDSVACAKILIAAGIAKKASSLPDLENRLRLSRGRAGDWGMKGPHAPMRKASSRSSSVPSNREGSAWRDSRRRESIEPQAVAEASGEYTVTPAEPSIDVQRLFVRADFIRPLSGQRVVFLGRMQQITDEEARQLACRLGGQCDEAVTRQTDLVVVGTTENADDPKQQAAEALRGEGQTIRIVNEVEFLSLVATPS